jgi:hypothetical protein
MKINALGNPLINWSKSYKFSGNLVGSFFNNKININVTGYLDHSNPMIINLPLVPSTGTNSLPVNLGALVNKGIEITANIRALQTRDWTWQIGFNSPIFTSSLYKEIDSKLDEFNKVAQTNKYLLRYKEGKSPTDMYAVRSKGINPANGQEIYLNAQGQQTFIYDPNDEVVVGNNRPQATGSINTQIRYKKFSLSLYTRYVIGHTQLHTVLYNKLENISPANREMNLDKRAFYDRWKEPGDLSPYRNASISSDSPLTDRFLVTENAFYLESANINYDFSGSLQKYLQRKLGINTINVGLNFNEFFKFQLSNIKLERGLDYPFSRNITFNLGVSF